MLRTIGQIHIWRNGLAAASAALSTMLINAPLLGDGRPEQALAPVSAFDHISPASERSATLFLEVAKVLQHPRCLNCHTSTDRPFQGDDPHPHIPRVTRGEANFGKPGMYCNTCHRAENYQIMPGNPSWIMAPKSTGWTDFGPGEICAQLKDRRRNGNRSLHDIHTHIMKDHLLAYSWAPPDHLEPAPGNREALGALIQAWIETGAVCPEE